MDLSNYARLILRNEPKAKYKFIATTSTDTGVRAFLNLVMETDHFIIGQRCEVKDSKGNGFAITVTGFDFGDNGLVSVSSKNSTHLFSEVRG